MDFAAELDQVLPSDLPHRTRVVELGARHLDRIREANNHFNLTRITGAHEAAVKHILDSILPWNRFAGATSILDAGTGPGFPGIPLAIALPDTRFTLAESVGKKATFVDETIDALGLHNVEVVPHRAEDLLKKRSFPIITARAVAPIHRALEYFGPAIRSGARAVLYKGPDVETEIAEAAPVARRQQIAIEVLDSYELPDHMGTRKLVEIRRFARR